MTHPVNVHPLASPWGRFGLYSVFIDAPEPAVVDAGIASSPAEGMAPALESIGRRIEDVRWILLTHGHIDHIGGAYALWELTGRRAQVVIHEADAPMLRSRRAHVEEYLAGRGRYLGDPEGEAKVTAATNAVISGEMEPSMLVKGGKTLGGGITVSVHSIPGHTPGSVAYVIDGRRSVFVGDAVQIHGAAPPDPQRSFALMTDFQTIRAGEQTIAVRKDLRVPMRDGVELAVDAYRGQDDTPRPALIAMSAYGKELQALALTTPPQRRPSPMWDGCIEAGDIARVVREGYAHVIGDMRGTGDSGGVVIGNYNFGGVPQGQDLYDLVEWVAAQPWCDGNVGMIGISYFGSMQVLAAAERPPHLKAIFVSGGHYDFYETTYHGGIMWFMPRTACASPSTVEGRTAPCPRPRSTPW
ncbi:CocE/NonD family hydrolase [Streptomyces sp. NPDC057729]|uniref:CocE/NonD family hydrolase n=2 Tax=Streptomyces TaxID=1883 RepID=UPI0036C46726